MTVRHFDRQGKPMTVLEWVLMQADDNYCTIRQDTYLISAQAEDVVAQVSVSTIWIGINASSTPDNPLIFETMTFAPPGSMFNDWNNARRRYATEDEACAGHEEICAEIRVMLNIIPEQKG